MLTRFRMSFKLRRIARVLIELDAAGNPPVAARRRRVVLRIP
jgi:hypothetical protein